MKKIVFAMIIFILVATLPMAAGAGKPAQLELNIRNQTGAVVSVDLVDANGNHIYKTLEEGVFPITLTEGIYSYYASLPCGNVSGQWNINVVKTLFLSCKQNTPAIGFNQSSKVATAVGLQCFMLSWTQRGTDYMEFWDGLNWDESAGSPWVDVVTLITDWENWYANEGDLNGGPIEVDCVNPPPYDLYMNYYDIR